MRAFENMWIKVIAVVMGLLLWLHVATEKTYNHQLYLPVTDIILKDGLTLLKAPPDSILVEVTASGKQLLRKKWRKRGLRINAANMITGRHEFNLTTTNMSPVGDDQSVTLNEIISPTSITLNIDFLTNSRVKVIPDIDATPDDGFAVARIAPCNPEEVSISGPRSTLGSFSTIGTERKVLSGLRNDITLFLAVAVPQGRGIKVEPDSVSITIEVVPVKTRAFERIPIVIFNLPVNTHASVEPRTLRVEITGPPREVDQLLPSDVVASVDFLARDNTDHSKVDVQCPPRFKVKKFTPSAVRVIAN